MKNDVNMLMESVNIAENLDDEQLNKIGSEAKDGFEQDLASRGKWDDRCKEWIKLANQVVEEKTYPWPGAANVKYPLLSTAAMQFAARAYPSLIPSDHRIVKGRPLGKDPDGSKSKVADAVSIYMSFQILEEMDGWEEEMDRLLIMLPIVGSMFKKTYWDKIRGVNCSRLVLPQNLVVDYWTASLREAERISEIIELSKRKVVERQQNGLWLDIDLGEPAAPEDATNPPVNDRTTPYEIIEQHTYLDLDEDGYEEPYIVTFERRSGKVLRIAARFDETTLHMTEDGEKISYIEPIEYYTKFGFVPNPDGGFYDIGFGVLLGPLNESVNTLINQLLDAGHLHSLQGGFLGKGLRLRMGETKFTPGEWKAVNAVGDDLKKQIVPLPTREPSKVLFELMGSLITSGKELASVAEIFVGKMPGQNTPATTTMASIEQGMKVFTAVYKRIYRSLDEEFKKLYALNARYMPPKTDFDVLGIPIGQELFSLKNHKVYPGADPTAISQSEKLMKAQGLMELLPSGVLDPVQVVIRVMEAQEQPRWEQLIRKDVAQSGQLPQQPDPKMQEMQMKGQLEQQKLQGKMQSDAQKAELEKRSAETQLQMKAQEHELDMQHRQQQLMMSAAEAQHKQRIFSAEGQLKMNQQMMDTAQAARHNEVTHQQKLRQAHESHQIKLAQAKKEPTKK